VISLDPTTSQRAYSNVRNGGQVRNSGHPEKVRDNDNARISHSKISNTELSRSEKRKINVNMYIFPISSDLTEEMRNNRDSC
jgi:hypothetical protein